MILISQICARRRHTNGHFSSAKNLREVVKTANTVDGKLVAVPQEVVAYGLFINVDLFEKYDLELPEKSDMPP